ncbi:unnamed protein product [Meloidogyne enterolobii]|uniref:Uncharacterized protein n=1 Tax=Meloidogyne enterolobii TaxID=390850 RepID=A0ACB1AWW5_MELEN
MNQSLNIQEAQRYPTITGPAMPQHTSIQQTTGYQSTFQNRPQTSVHQTTVPQSIPHTITQIGSQTSNPLTGPQQTVHLSVFQNKPQSSGNQTTVQNRQASDYNIAAHQIGPQIDNLWSRPQSSVHQKMVHQGRPHSSGHQATFLTSIHHKIPQSGSQTANPLIRPQPPVHHTMFHNRPETSVHQTTVPPSIQHELSQLRSQTVNPLIRPQPTVQQTTAQTVFHQTTAPPSIYHTITQIGSQTEHPPTNIMSLRFDIDNINKIVSNMEQEVVKFHENPSFYFDTILKLEEFLKQLSQISKRLYLLRNEIVLQELISLLVQQIINLINGIKEINRLLGLFPRNFEYLLEKNTPEFNLWLNNIKKEIQLLLEKMLKENETIKNKQIKFLTQNNQSRQKQSQGSSETFNASRNKHKSTTITIPLIDLTEDDIEENEQTG